MHPNRLGPGRLLPPLPHHHHHHHHHQQQHHHPHDHHHDHHRRHHHYHHHQQQLQQQHHHHHHHHHDHHDHDHHHHHHHHKQHLQHFHYHCSREMALRCELSFGACTDTSLVLLFLNRRRLVNSFLGCNLQAQFARYRRGSPATDRANGREADKTHNVRQQIVRDNNPSRWLANS